jgi:hypothetical protein
MSEDDYESPYGDLPPHQRHSETSKAAAESMRYKIGPLHRRIMEFLRLKGATDEAMQIALDMNPNTQRPRRRELELMGYIVDSGYRTVTLSGREAVIWELAMSKGIASRALEGK